jgi:hypothetical protein
MRLFGAAFLIMLTHESAAVFQLFQSVWVIHPVGSLKISKSTLEQLTYLGGTYVQKALVFETMVESVQLWPM